MKSLILVLMLLARSSMAADGFSSGAPCPGCSVVLVSFDALQASHVHALGYPKPTTPTIDALASTGALFGQAISPAPWTVPAHMSWMTGTFPTVHGVVNKFAVRDGKRVVSRLQELSPGMATLAGVLRARGYATGGFTGSAGVHRMFGFDQGFDVYSDEAAPFSGMETSIPKAEAWLGRLGKKKFFLFLHGYGNHGQYMPAGGYDRRFVDPPYEGPYDGSPAQQRVLRELGLRGPIRLDDGDVAYWRQVYDEKISRTDALFGGFLRTLESLGVKQRTVFVLASDHGTEQYEHGKFDHGFSLYDELERVLLVVVSPGIKPKVVAEQVGTIDIMPTILSIVGIEPEPAVRAQMRGRSLLGLMRGEESAGEDVFMETDYRLLTHKRGIRTRDGWKLVLTAETGKTELYNLRDDPGEAVDRSSAEPERAKQLEERVRRHYRSLGSDLSRLELGCSPVYADQCR
ncbi:MAG: sulfatase [Elusimicrobia bacterium]|nr:sulfatase [Elusimicrobiota bacterium]